MIPNTSHRRCARALFRYLRRNTISRYLCELDLQCYLCQKVYLDPVTTPCNHSFCKICILRSLDYTNGCPVCKSSLTDFNAFSAGTCTSIKNSLDFIDAPKNPPPWDINVIPILVCTVAFPRVPCPLLVLERCYWHMVRQILFSGFRKFGMIAIGQNGNTCQYGTILEISDCVNLKNGGCILTTLGLNRFIILERSKREGYEIARIDVFTDITKMSITESTETIMLGHKVYTVCLKWISLMSCEMRENIERTFGALPALNGYDNECWWFASNGPAWLWWLIAVLPLNTDLKVLILSTKILSKRMQAVLATLNTLLEEELDR